MADSILWHWQDVLKAVGSAVSGDGPEMTGVSIDSRTLQQGDLFVPISEKLPAPYNQIQGARNDMILWRVLWIEVLLPVWYPGQ